MNIFDFLYPARCAVCDQILKMTPGMQHRQNCCVKCQKTVVRVQQPYCYRCGKPVISEHQEYCEDCKKHPKSFHWNRAVFLYDEQMQASIANFKFHNRREYAVFYAEQIVRQYGEKILETAPDGVLAVPIHKAKRRERGYNQAELVARELGKLLKIPYYNNVLFRTVNTLPQKELNNIQRLKNLEKAFQLNENSVKLKKVLIIDDIYTTGSTLEACSRILKAGGVSNVYCVTIATGQGY